METKNVDIKFRDLIRKFDKLDYKHSYKALKANVLSALEVYPNDPYLLTDLSYAEYRLDNIEAAKDYVKRAETINPQFGYMLCHKAWLLYDCNAPFQETFDAWKVIIDLPLSTLIAPEYDTGLIWAKSRQTDAYFYVANLLMANGEYDEAERYARCYLEKRKPGVWSNFSKKGVEDFLSDLTFYKQNNLIPPSRETGTLRMYLSKVEKYIHTSSYRLLKKQLLEALEIYPKDVYFLTEMSHAEYQLGNINASKEYMERAEKINPYHCILRYYKAWLAFVCDAPIQEAIDAWKIIIDSPIESLTSKKYDCNKRWAQSIQIDAYFYIAILLNRLEKYDEAERYARCHLERRKRGFWSSFSKTYVEDFLRKQCHS